ncbi:dienelactone hydrolase family protein [Ottowia thiooxydans]|uniref:Dienelactone hydrolase n=1 Tax=Ottowia thiooxydans TaxID=219182 RepID=A0ABV2QA83_9BURK
MTVEFKDARRVAYNLDGKGYSGQMVRGGSGASLKPGLLMAPNFFGVTQEAVERARMLAGDRYVVFVVDMHGDGHQPTGFPEAEAGAAMFKADPGFTRRLMRAGLEAFISAGRENQLLGEHVAAVGFCLGGRNVLELARAGADLCAAVSIHGELQTTEPAQSGLLKADMLAIHASKDPLVPGEQLGGFKREMDGANAHWRLVVMGGQLHAFTDPGINVPDVARYNERASQQSYALLNAFIDEAIAARSEPGV